MNTFNPEGFSEGFQPFLNTFTTTTVYAVGGGQSYPESHLVGRISNSAHPCYFSNNSHHGNDMAILFNVPRLMRNLGAVPPSLPPSVEEAYRRKCIQLKQRMNEVEEANDASRQRIVRMERSIQKMRLERAFLLEQLSKRTSTNVEDSEGSPSPPPTVCHSPAIVKLLHKESTNLY